MYSTPTSTQILILLPQASLLTTTQELQADFQNSLSAKLLKASPWVFTSFITQLIKANSRMPDFKE